MFLGKPFDLKVPALDSKNFTIDFTQAHLGTHIIPHLILAMNPALEGEDLALLKVIDYELTREYILVVRVHSQKSFRGQVNALRKILAYRDMELRDYRIIAPAWVEERALAVDLAQRLIKQLDDMGGVNTYFPEDFLYQHLTIDYALRAMTLTMERLVENHAGAKILFGENIHTADQSKIDFTPLRRPVSAWRLILRTAWERFTQTIPFFPLRTS